MKQEELSQILWVSGSFFFRKRTLREIKEAIGEHLLYICDNKETKIEYFENLKNACDLLDEKNRIFIFRAIPESSNSTTTNKKFINLINSLPKNIYVIVDGIDNTEKPTIFKYVQENGKVISYDKYMSRERSLTWISDRLRQKGKEIELPILELMIDSIGLENEKGINTDRLYMFVFKLINFLGRDKSISKEDAYKIQEQYSNVIVFKLYEILDQRNYNQFIKTVYQLCLNEGVISGVTTVFNILLWRFRLLLILKEMLNKKKTSNEIMEHLKNNLFKLEKEGSFDKITYKIEQDSEGKNKPCYSQNVLNNYLNGFYGKKPDIEKYSRKEIFRAIKCIEDCLIMIRNNISEEECLLLTDNFIMTLFNMGDHDELIKMREFKQYV